MSKKKGNRNFRISPEIAKGMGLDINVSGQYRLSKTQQEEYFSLKFKKDIPSVNDFENESVTETNQYENSKISSVLSARNADGTIMTPEVYCTTYGLDPANMKSWKLITHTGIPYYNIASQSIEIDEAENKIDFLKKIDDLVQSYRPKVERIKHAEVASDKILQIVISDTHIGMDASQGGVSLYGGSWSKEDLNARLSVVEQQIQETLSTLGNNVDCIQVINLGDFADGLDGFTVRRGHELPQNMTNEQVFDTGVEFLTNLLDFIVLNANFNKLIWYNVCNSNHSSSFDYFICQAFKGRARAAYEEDFVEVINERKFIGHFTHGSHTEIITHGKDDVSLKFGFKAQLDQKGKEKIDEYIRFHKLLTLGTYLNFHKGDSHQFVHDKTEDFDFTSYLALSPSSGWVQVNFKSGRSGFSIIVKDKFNYASVRKDVEFEWGTNRLK